MTNKADKKQNEFIPPKAVADCAKKGLLLKEKFNRGGTKVGWKRARELSDRKPVASADITKISSYFARHEIDKDSENFGDDNNPSKGYIAWLLWGGDAGRKWANEMKSHINDDTVE